MNRLSRMAGVLFLAAAATACQEKLVSPTQCPDLCPGTSPSIRDTVLTPLLGLDSTFTGYLSAAEVGALLVSNGLDAGEARAWAVFPNRSDSVTVDATSVTYTVDSAAFVFELIARDTLVDNLSFVVYRIPARVDTTSTLAEIDAALTPANVIDSGTVHDTLRTGQVSVVFRGDALAKVLPVEDDSGFVGIGIRISAPSPTGVRLGSGSGFSPPLFTTWVHANVTDTAKQRQVITLGPDRSNYAFVPPPVPGLGGLFLGGKTGSRVLLRFALPQAMKDSGAVLRATLELTPSSPIKGLPNDPGQLQIRGVLVDLGAKSPPLGSIAAVAELAAGATVVQNIDLRAVVATWFGVNGATPTILLGIAPDGGTFARAEFFSTLAGVGAPRLRITYAVSSYPGTP